MDNKIASFEEFKKMASGFNEEAEEVLAPAGGKKKENYMLFQNLASIKRSIENILKLDPAKVDELIKDGHGWALDHLATSKDDVQEVSDWLMNELEPEESDDIEKVEIDSPEFIEGPENIQVEIEDEDEEGEDEEDEDEEVEDEEGEEETEKGEEDE